MHSLVSKSKQPVTHRSVAPVAPCKGARGFMIAKPLTSSLKLIIGILQNNLKTCAFCAHSAHSAAGRLEIGRIPYQNRRQWAYHASVAGKRGGAAGHSQPKLVAAHPVRDRYLRRKHRRARHGFV